MKRREDQDLPEGVHSQCLHKVFLRHVCELRMQASYAGVREEDVEMTVPPQRIAYDLLQGWLVGRVELARVNFTCWV